MIVLFSSLRRRFCIWQLFKTCWARSLAGCTAVVAEADSVRNVWRAPFRASKSEHLHRIGICYVLCHFGGCCPRSDSVRNVWHAVVRCVRATLPGPTLMPFARRCVSWWVFGQGDVKMALLGAYVAGCRRQPSANRIRKGWSAHVGGVALSAFVSAKPLSHTWTLSARASNSDG